MSETVLSLIKMAVRFTIVLTGIFAFILVITLATSYLTISTNAGVLSDLFAIVQIWLPFNLSALITWIITASTAFIAYRLTIYSINYISAITGRS